MALTPEEILDIRILISDYELKDDSEYVLSDTVIQSIYDASSQNTLYTVIRSLMRMLGYYTRKIAMTNQIGNNEQYNQLYEHTERLLQKYLDILNSGNADLFFPGFVYDSTPSRGYIDLSIDENQNTLDSEYAEYCE